ncbi:MAG: ferric reductase-like transmembrane domain-containing protein, partial [Gammaproteobacteria bacterium]|nr:ferric reductase-like transmembrane domain-containing protein [Gammaproteobacteria bacterium]
MRLIVLLGLYALAIVAPLLLAWHYFGNPRGLPQELGTILGMLAFAMILSEFALSGRLKSFSESVGMDATMRFHRTVGWLALSAALLHPFFYGSTPSGGLFPWDSSREFSIASEFAAIATGVIALVLLPALIVLAVWRSALDYRYEVWRRLHGVLAAVIALLLLHHTLEAGRYAMHKNVALLWQILTALAILS